ncbi:MAG TPA: SUMF1/EgtB/PvdO family nonheme iron enzyme [Myxococcota bacterium]
MRIRLVPLLALLVGAPWAAPAVTLPPELVPIGAPGNAPDAGNLGAVDYVFEIGKYEVTNAQYAAFLNAVAKEDYTGLWSFSQGSNPAGGIEISGSPGSWVYTVKEGFADKPVVFVSFLAALRFANWLHHGMPTGPAAAALVEKGSYDLSADEPLERLPRATWVIPHRHEWYKAAYYHPPDALGGAAWFDYATRSNVAPTQATCAADGTVANPGANVAVYGQTCNWNGTTTGNFADVGTAGGPSAFGTYDQTGNAQEMVARYEYPGVLLVGGGTQDTGDVSASYVAGIAANDANGARGFRVAYLPEPAAAPAAALLALAALRARRAGRPVRRRP